MICFGSNNVSDKQTVTKMPGKTNLLSSIKLKSIFKNPLTYNKKYSIKEEIPLQLKNKKCKKWHFIRSTLNITNISLIDRNLKNSNNRDGGSDGFNNDDGDFDNKDGDDKDNDDGDTNDDGVDDEKFSDDGCTNHAGDDNDDGKRHANDDGGDDEK